MKKFSSWLSQKLNMMYVNQAFLALIDLFGLMELVFLQLDIYKRRTFTVQ